MCKSGVTWCAAGRDEQAYCQLPPHVRDRPSGVAHRDQATLVLPQQPHRYSCAVIMTANKKGAKWLLARRSKGQGSLPPSAINKDAPPLSAGANRLLAPFL